MRVRGVSPLRVWYCSAWGMMRWWWVRGLTASRRQLRARAQGGRCSCLRPHPPPGEVCAAAPLTLPGYNHDVCAAFFPLGLGSPFFSQLPLSNYGLSYIQPPAPVAHPFEDGKAAVVYQNVERTAEQLDRTAEPTAGSWNPW